jgi:hypothetical protein
MKILCVSFDTEADLLATDPQRELAGHDVTIVNTYREAVSMITDPARGVPSFDIVLTDGMIPHVKAESGDLGPGGVLLMMWIERNLIRGLGIFVPEYFQEVCTIDFHGYQAVVASKECWTPNDKRDWVKMLRLVVGAVESLERES